MFRVPGTSSEAMILTLLLTLQAASLAAQQPAGRQKVAAPDGKVVAALVDLLKLSSGETTRNEVGEIVPTPEAMDRARTVSARLARMGRPAWPLLFPHLGDKRASMPAKEAPGPHTVGMMVHATIRSQIVSYPGRYPNYKFSKNNPSDHQLDSVFQPSLKDWLATRENRSIEEIQIELLQHVIELESGIQPPTENTRRNLSDFRVRLANLRTMQEILHPPKAASDRLATGPDQQAKTIAALVDQLEFRPADDDLAAIDQAYSTDELATIDRIYLTAEKLRAMGRPAWARLATHLNDKRPCIPTGDVRGPNLIGAFVYRILWSEVVSIPTRGYPSHKASAFEDLTDNFRPSLADWLKARDTVPLEDIQISLVKTLIRLELREEQRGEQTDKDVSNLQSHLKNLKLVKAAVFGPDKPPPAAQ